MNRAYKFRIYPTEYQKELFAKTFGCCRFIWNTMLSDKIKHYEETKETLHNTPAMYKDEFPFLREVDSLALCNVQLNLQKAYNNFFKKPKTGFPKFKSRHHSRASYITNNNNNNIRISNNSIQLPKAGVVKAKIHRSVPKDYKLKSATISMERDNSYYCSLLFEYDEVIASSNIDEEYTIGLDYKSDGLFVDSNGKTCGSPKFFRKVQKRLAKEQRRLSRKKKGSSNYGKQKAKVAHIHRHVANQRKDFLHKVSTEITNQYTTICVEDLNMQTLSNKGFKNGKATTDNGWGMFLTYLEYKQKDRGHHFVKVDKFYPSSQTCHECGYKNPLVKDLSVRKWTCPNCGAIHDRDINAANNIKIEGLRLLQQNLLAA